MEDAEEADECGVGTRERLSDEGEVDECTDNEDEDEAAEAGVSVAVALEYDDNKFEEEDDEDEDEDELRAGCCGGLIAEREEKSGCVRGVRLDVAAGGVTRAEDVPAMCREGADGGVFREVGVAADDEGGDKRIPSNLYEGGMGGG